MWPVLIPPIFSFIYGLKVKDRSLKTILIWLGVNFLICVASSFIAVETSINNRSFYVFQYAFVLNTICVPILFFGIWIGNSVKSKHD
jgi:hypothetical protein